jgi:hypothetical protein
MDGFKCTSRLTLSIALSLIFQMISSEGRTQIQFFQPGAEWYYAYYQHLISEEKGYTKYVYSKDTLVAGVVTRKIEHMYYRLDLDNPLMVVDSFAHPPWYMTQSGDSILVFNGQEFELNWRLNPAVGDTFMIKKNSVMPFEVHIDSIKSGIIEGHEIKIFFLTGTADWGRAGQELVIDLFGPFSTFDYSSHWGNWEGPIQTLCRYKNDVIGTIDIGGPYCENFSTSVYEFMASSIEIYPNPFSEFFTISLDREVGQKVRLELFNYCGALVFSRTTIISENRMDFNPAIPSGAYFGRIISGSDVLTFKVLKQ